MTHPGRDGGGGGGRGGGDAAGVEDDESFVQPLSDSETAAILHGVLLGISYLHRAGTLHRDLRARNVYLSTEDGGGVGQVR